MALQPHQLKPGDHIFTNCSGGIYTHHGIYVGESKVNNPNNGNYKQIKHAVIHFIGIDKNGKSLKSSGQCKECFYKQQNGVVLTCIDCFLGGSAIYRYEYGVSLIGFNFRSNGTCSTLTCYEPPIVLLQAYAYHRGINHFGEYNLVFNNCEHFTTKCKTGFAICNQVLWGTGLSGAIVNNVARIFIGF